MLTDGQVRGREGRESEVVGVDLGVEVVDSFESDDILGGCDTGAAATQCLKFDCFVVSG